nr:regulatory protein [Salmonella enterica subsp. enterica serovar Typhi]
MASTNQELASALRMFSRFFDLIHQPLAVINERGEYVYYNQESADLDGYSIERAMGKHMLDVYPGMKETQSTMLSSLKKGVEYIKFITMREARPLTISTPPRRSMQAMAAWSALSKSAGICPASGGSRSRW